MKTQLTDKGIAAAKEPGRLHDQHGLILRVLPSGRKNWLWRGTVGGKRCDRGLGGYPEITLAQARDKALTYRKLSRQGVDPSASLDEHVAPTFGEAVERVIELHSPTWKTSGRHEQMFRSAVRDYAMPSLGHLRVSEIARKHVIDVLEPIWSSKHPTAKRLRQYISLVMKWATSQGYRADDPTDVVSAVLPKIRHDPEHRLALPHGEVGRALAKLRESDAYLPALQCFEFLTLSAVRSGEARLARWDEISFRNKVWTIPKERMKSAKEHHVPLSTQAIEILRAAKGSSKKDRSAKKALVFPSPTGIAMEGRYLSDLCRQNQIACVPHGMRSSFRDWAAECTDASDLACELALAHVDVDRIQDPYVRTDLLDERRQLMQDWADYVAGADCVVAAALGGRTSLMDNSRTRAIGLNRYGRDLVVGDVHGCFGTLEHALADLRFDARRDRLFGVGDLVARGPRSAEAIEWLEDRFEAVTLGNHDRVALAWFVAKLHGLRAGNPRTGFGRLTPAGVLTLAQSPAADATGAYR